MNWWTRIEYSASIHKPLPLSVYFYLSSLSLSVLLSYLSLIPRHSSLRRLPITCSWPVISLCSPTCALFSACVRVCVPVRLRRPASQHVWLAPCKLQVYTTYQRLYTWAYCCTWIDFSSIVHMYTIEVDIDYTIDSSKSLYRIAAPFVSKTQIVAMKSL